MSANTSPKGCRDEERDKDYFKLKKGRYIDENFHNNAYFYGIDEIEKNDNEK